MLVRLTSRNQLTLPEDIVAAFPGVSCFEVAERSGHIVLSPVHLDPAGPVRRKLQELGINEEDVREAKQWARRGG